MIEVLIAKYIHDSFIRPYLGDVIVVILIYAFIRSFIPEKIKMLPILIFIFAVIIELLQYIQILDRLGLSENRFIRILIGGTFDWKDIMCYGVGVCILMIFERIKSRYR